MASSTQNQIELGIDRYRLRNNKLNGFLEKNRFWMQKCRWLRHLAVSFIVSNHRLGRSYGLQPGSITMPTLTNPPVSFHVMSHHLLAGLTYLWITTRLDEQCTTRTSSRGHGLGLMCRQWFSDWGNRFACLLARPRFPASLLIVYLFQPLLQVLAKAWRNDAKARLLLDLKQWGSWLWF